MRIVMLGHSNVGKTTYMASMYGTMQQRVNGFTLNANDPRHHGQLLAAHQAVRQGRYPAATDQRGEYAFHLCHDGQKFFPFTWTDIRGGAILERSSSEQASQLLADLAQCDGILIFCDADAAARGRSVTNQLGRISNLVGQAINRLERTVPLGLVFTKADLVEELDDRIVQSVNGLVEAVAASKHVIGTVIPVACGPAEMNVPAPVLFALYFGVLLKHNALVDQVKDLKDYLDGFRTF